MFELIWEVELKVIYTSYYYLAFMNLPSESICLQKWVQKEIRRAGIEPATSR